MFSPDKTQTELKDLAYGKEVKRDTNKQKAWLYPISFLGGGGYHGNFSDSCATLRVRAQ